MMQGLMFGGEGPIMQGNWYNPHTGDAFTVRDSFFEDNQYVVTTTDGRYLYYSQLQNYVQTDMKLDDLKKMKEEKKVIDEPLPAEVAGLLESNENIDPYSEYLLPEDDIISQPTGKSLGNINDVKPRHLAPASEHQVKSQSVTISMNAACIEKALKNAPMPKFNIKLEWNDYPTKNIEMLKDIMDIPMEEIIDWYLEKINMLEIAENIKEIMQKHIIGDVKNETIPVSPALSREELIDNTEKVKKSRKPTKKQSN